MDGFNDITNCISNIKNQNKEKWGLKKAKKRLRKNPIHFIYSKVRSFYNRLVTGFVTGKNSEIPRKYRLKTIKK